MTKRILSILVVVLMVMALIPMSALASGASRSGNAVDSRTNSVAKDAAVTFDFETEPTDWTFVDSDGDGFNWAWEDSSSTPHMTPYEGNGMIYSESYHNNESGSGGTVLTPDNWAISPAVEVPADATTLSFWVAGQDPSYAAEHYAVYAGTTADTTAMVEIMPESVATGSYTQQFIDISAYAGQTVYFAFRHFNISDMFVLNIDFVEISDATEPPPPAMGFYFEEDSEWAEFTLVDADNDTYNWARRISDSQYPAYEGNGCAYSASYFSGTYPSKTSLYNVDNWLITPAIEVPAVDPYLSYYAKNYSGTYADTLEVYVGTSTDIAEMTSVIAAYEPGTAYQAKTFDLAAYAGQTIYVAFRHTGSDDWALMLDAVEIFGSNEEPVEPTDEPVEPTDEPVEPTDEPVEPSDLDIALNVEGGEFHFVSDGQYPWFVVEDGDRVFAQSGNGGVASSTSTVITVVEVGEEGATVSFDYKAWGEGSSDSYDWDKCRFYVDDEMLMDYGAHDNDWENISFDLEAGKHVLAWTYKKDSSVNPNGDYFQVDNVAFDGEVEPSTILPESITVNDVTVLEGFTATVSYTVLPENALDKSVTFEVADTSVATVDENGVITGVAVGTTTVTVTSVANPEVSATANVTVNPYDPTAMATVTLNVPTDHWGDGSGYQMLLDFDHNTYGVIIPETGPLTTSGDADPSVYAEFEYKIPENADGSCNTSNMVNSTSVTINVPAGIYDYVITNPTPGDRIWIATNNGTAPGRADDFEFVAGQSYVFTVTLDDATGNDRVDFGGDVPQPTEPPTPTTPPEPPVGGTIWDFETDPVAQGWSFEDRDGDGYNWTWNYGPDYADFVYYEGQGYMASNSYVNYVGALTPDNWAITPEFEVPANNAQISFWANGQDPSWCDEVFGVYVLVGGQEIKLGADVTVTADPTEYVYDLSDYAGETIKFAIRHYNVTDMFILNMDYVVVSGEGGVTPPPTPELGDVDQDGDVDLQDALTVMRYAQSLIGGEGLDLEAADVNLDGEINFIDALLILRYAMGLIPELPLN